jgi:beta-glucosidase
MQKKPFSKDFLWGAATSSYQVEGGIEQCDWAEAAREGRVPPCGRACDHYHRFREDFALAKKMGHTAQRFSVEWSRIEPEEGKFDEKEIMHYREVLLALRAEGLEPYLCLWHWTLPLWLSHSGGIERADFPDIFARYAEYVMVHLGEFVSHVSTLNEPYTTIVNGWMRGTFPPFKAFPPMQTVALPHASVCLPRSKKNWFAFFYFFTLANTLIRAHNSAYKKISAVAPTAKVSVVFQVLVCDGVGFLGKMWARLISYHMNVRFLNRVAPFCDEIGINFYFWKTFFGKEVHKKTDMDWDARPFGIYHALMLAKKYKKPILVAEVGCADAKDTLRPWYIAETVRGVVRAVEEGADVQGLFYWSLLDNYEWAHGFEKRFGLIEVNFDTQERTIRPSAWVLKEEVEKQLEK